MLFARRVRRQALKNPRCLCHLKILVPGGLLHRALFSGLRTQKAPYSELDPKPELRRKWDSHCGTWTEEVAQCTGRHAELLVAGDRLGRGTSCVETKGGRVGEVVHREWQRRDVRDVIVAGIGSI